MNARKQVWQYNNFSFPFKIVTKRYSCRRLSQQREWSILGFAKSTHNYWQSLEFPVSYSAFVVFFRLVTFGAVASEILYEIHFDGRAAVRIVDFIRRNDLSMRIMIQRWCGLEIERTWEGRGCYSSLSGLFRLVVCVYIGIIVRDLTRFHQDHYLIG